MPPSAEGGSRVGPLRPTFARVSAEPPRVRDAQPSDAAPIAEIYNHYVLRTWITFEEEPVAGAEMARRVAEVAQAGHPWLVAEGGGRVLGYAYASQWKGRCAYRYSAESTVYLAADACGQGLGTRLYRELFERLRTASMHVVIGGIALPNPASVALHERFGMRRVATFEQVGFKFGRWIDVAYWQTTLTPVEAHP